MKLVFATLELLCALMAVAASGYQDDYGGYQGGGGYHAGGGYGGGNDYGGGAKYSSGYAKHEEYPAYDRDYSFNYGVKDDYTYNYQTRDEVKKGNTVYGSYTVVEPDGNLRVVKYEADDYGFRAVVDREGYGAPVSYGHESSYKGDSYGEAPYKAAAPSYNDYAPPPPVYKAAPYKAPAYKAPAYKASSYKAPSSYGAPQSSSYSSASSYPAAPSSSYSPAPSYKASAPVYGKRPAYSKPPSYKRPSYSSNYGAQY